MMNDETDSDGSKNENYIEENTTNEDSSTICGQI